MKYFIQVNTSYNTRTEEHQGRDHLVVPVVMMVEGVHNGSLGPLFHPADELGRFPGAWNGIPVVIQHPENDGENVSANDPGVIDREIVGRVYNTEMVGNKLKSEAWLDIGRITQVSPQALAAIRNQSPLDVSVGVFNDQEEVPGIWNNEQYTAIARNFRPDHLALLPGGTGACSWADGCGIRVNKQKKKGGEDVKKPELDIYQVAVYNSDNKVADINDNENGYRELIQLLQSELDSKDTQVKYHYLTELYDNRVIYEVRTQGEGSQFYQSGYTVTNDDDVELTGDPVEVRRDVNFVTLEKKKGLIRTVFNNVKKEVKVKTNECPDCIKKVDALIANEVTKFTSDDKEWLSTLEEGVLDKLIPEVKEEVKTDPVMNAEQVIKDYEDKMTPEERLKKLPAETQEQLDRGLKMYNDQRTAMAKVILDNTEKDVWTEDSLKALTMDTLEGLFKSVNKGEEVNYIGLGANNEKREVIETNEELLLPPGVEIEMETKK